MSPITDPSAHVHGSKYAPRLLGDARKAKAYELARGYTAGATIRGLVAEHHITYGTVRKLLLEAKVRLRPRGGARPQY